MKFNIEDYPGKYIMHCPTEESAKIFTAYLHSLGKQWCDGASYLENTYWKYYGKDMCYAFNANEYGSLGYYAGTDCEREILEFYDFDWGIEPPYEVSIVTLDEILKEVSNITLDEILGLEEKI